MGSLPLPSLPIIDISPFLIYGSDNDSRKKCSVALYDACINHGFFYLTNHFIPSSLTDRILSLARHFFIESTEEDKQRIKRQNAGVRYGDGARGYQVIGDNVTQGQRDWHEAIDWYRPIVKGEYVSSAGAVVENDYGEEHVDGDTGNGDKPGRQPPFELLRGVNLWPSKPAEFKMFFDIYIQKLHELGTAVVRAMGHALDLEDPETFVKATRESFWVMRAIGYPPLPSRNGSLALAGSIGSEGGSCGSEEDMGGVSCGAHTDYGCLTILLADQTKGALQVQSRSGGWINADPIDGAFVVNVGDMMERWTNGLWKSTLHRVVHKGQGYRLSVPFFFEPDYGAKVKPLKECVQRSGNGKRWEEVEYGQHLISKVSGNFYGGGEE
ncbi:hypothetical protein MMC06_004974 [Schaereria dolodes]|nr:hypothetical protein [Schaereria dolodes]